MKHKSKNKTRPLFTLSLEMTRLVNETRLLLVPGVNSDIIIIQYCRLFNIGGRTRGAAALPDLKVPYISELTPGTNRSLVSFTSLVISSDNVNRGLVLLLLLCLIYKPGHN